MRSEKLEALKGLIVFLYQEGDPNSKRKKRWFLEHITKCLDAGMPKLLLEDILKEFDQTASNIFHFLSFSLP